MYSLFYCRTQEGSARTSVFVLRSAPVGANRRSTGPSAPRLAYSQIEFLYLFYYRLFTNRICISILLSDSQESSARTSVFVLRSAPVGANRRSTGPSVALKLFFNLLTPDSSRRPRVSLSAPLWPMHFFPVF